MQLLISSCSSGSSQEYKISRSYVLSKASPVQTRKEHLKKESRCYICLRKSHLAKDCSAKSCFKCKKRPR